MDKTLKASLEIINRVVPQWTVDRIEEGWAVLNNTDTLESINIPLSLLPQNTNPGDTLIRLDGKWYKNDTETAARKQRISERFARIRAKK